MDDEQQIVPPSSEVASPPTAEATGVAAAATAQPPAEAKSRRDLIAEGVARENAKAETRRGQHAVYQPRADAGKFAPGSPNFPVPERPPMPKSLRQELKAHWDAAPPELAAAIAKREEDAERGFAEFKNKTLGDVQTAREVLDQFQPYEWILKNEGTTPAKAIGPLLQTAAILRTGTPAQKAQSVATVMQQYNIPIEHIQQMLGFSNGRPQPIQDPQYNSLAQQVQEIRQTLTQDQRRKQQEEERRLTAEVETFAKDPANVHFDAVLDTMLTLINAPGVLGDTSAMTDREKLQKAYDTAIRLNPELSAQVEAARLLKQKNKAAVGQSKAAAVQVAGAPGSNGFRTAIDPNDRRAVLVNSFQHHGLLGGLRN